MANRGAEGDFLSAFFADDRVLEPLTSKQHMEVPSFRSASRPLHTGYIRPLHLIGAEAKKSAKIQKASEDDFWDSNCRPNLPRLDAEMLPTTAVKPANHRDITAQKLAPLAAIRENLSNPACDVRVGSVDSILNEVRPGIRLNRVQSSVKDCIFNSNENAVVGAPTGNPHHEKYIRLKFLTCVQTICPGCGKTVVMEMAICKLYQQSTSESKAMPKILYIAPIKQLVTEKRMEWERWCTSNVFTSEKSLLKPH